MNERRDPALRLFTEPRRSGPSLDTLVVALLWALWFGALAWILPGLATMFENAGMQWDDFRFPFVADILFSSPTLAWIVAAVVAPCLVLWKDRSLGRRAAVFVNSLLALLLIACAAGVSFVVLRELEPVLQP